MAFVLVLMLMLYALRMSSAQCPMGSCQSEWPICQEIPCNINAFVSLQCDDWVIGPDNLCLQICPPGLREKTWRITRMTGYEKIIRRCVAELCPDKKPYYHDYKCVDSCPPDSPYITPDYQCITKCTYGLKTLLPSNGTSKMFDKKCVYDCNDTEPYAYQDFCMDRCPVEAPYSDKANMCLTGCPANMQILTENKVTRYGHEVELKCVPTCPDIKPYIYNGTCVDFCPANASFSDVLNKCLAQCSDGLKSLAENITTQGHMIERKSCVRFCPNSKPYNYNGTCVEACPLEASYTAPLFYTCVANCTAYKKSYTFTDSKFGMRLCVFGCPDVKPYSYEGVCVEECPTVAPYSDITKTCFANCTGSMKMLTEENITSQGQKLEKKRCVPECPDNKPYVYEDTCLESCPSVTIYIDQTKVCLTNCTSGMKMLTSQGPKSENRSCVNTCPVYKPFSTDDTCVDSCPSDTVYIDATKTCFSRCPALMQTVSETNMADQGNVSLVSCVFTCPNSKPFTYNGTCVERCPSDASFSNITKSCLANCANSMKTFKEINSTSQGHNLEFKWCVMYCPESKPYTYDDECVERCPLVTYYHDRTKTCITNCTDGRKTFIESKMTVHGNVFETRICTEVCPNSKPYSYEGSCLEICPSEASYSDSAEMCVTNCSAGMRKLTYLNETATGQVFEFKRCIDVCPDSKPYVYDGNCVDRCPSNASYSDPTNNCSAYCATGMYKFTDTNTTAHGHMFEMRKCVKACPDSKSYAYNGTCVHRCPAEAVFIGPNKHCAQFCNSIIVTKEVIEQNERYEEQMCVEQCPGFKPFAIDIFTCAERCPKDKPYTYNSFKLTCAEKCYHFTDNMTCTESCPDGTRFVDGDGNCLRVNDCPPGTRFRDIFIYKDEGIVQCLQACNDNKVFFERTCIYERDCIYPRFVYNGECKTECPNGYVYYITCASKSVLCLVGGLLLAPTMVLLLFCRHDMCSVRKRYILVWKVLIRKIDISKVDPCSCEIDNHDVDIESAAESVAGDDGEPINDRRQLLV